MLRYSVFLLVLVATGAVLALSSIWPAWRWGLALALPLLALGIWDQLQRRHTLLRNYPISGRLRYLFESVRPQIQQYFVEDDLHGRPFNREQRSIVYQRAKGDNDYEPFGTEHDVYRDGAEWIAHGISPADKREAPRVRIGGEQCGAPYEAALLNISAMSFGSLGPHAIRALNIGACRGGFAHDTGEGGISRHHRLGADLIWEIGSGYFGCRQRDGSFDPEAFAEQAAGERVKMIELKLSQGAKPGRGGVLPGAKVTAEIAEARGVQPGEDCISPPRHSVFSTPLELVEFLARLRELAGGKPVGFKLCIGHPWEFLSICKAMLETGIRPDFVVVDGKEGGTGAAPEEFSDNVGMPLREGLTFVRNALAGADLRGEIRIGAAGKIVTGFDMARTLALGADWCNSARGFMLALGCVQSLKCHTDHCPTGITTQNPLRNRGLVVEDKAERARRYQCATLEALMGLVAAAGLETPAALRPRHIAKRVGLAEITDLGELYPRLDDGELADGASDPWYRRQWEQARVDSFAPAD